MKVTHTNYKKILTQQQNGKNYESNLTTGEEIEIGEEKELSIVVDGNRSETVLLNYCTVHACVVAHSSVNVWSFGV
jgi:hypothetical protein